MTVFIHNTIVNIKIRLARHIFIFIVSSVVCSAGFYGFSDEPIFRRGKGKCEKETWLCTFFAGGPLEIIIFHIGRIKERNIYKPCIRRRRISSKYFIYYLCAYIFLLLLRWFWYVLRLSMRMRFLLYVEYHSGINNVRIYWNCYWTVISWMVHS